MMKFLSMLAVLFCGAMLVAGTDIDVNGKFAGSTIGERAPKGWLFNDGIKPVGTGKVVKVGDELGVHITSPKAGVHYYCAKQFPVVPGEKYEVSCDVTGTGVAGVGVYYYDAKGSWAGAIYQPSVKLKPGENDVKYTFTVPAEVKGKVPGLVRFAFFVYGAADATFTDFEVEKEDGK